MRSKKGKTAAAGKSGGFIRYSRERQIVLLDQGPLRKKAASECSRQLTRLEKAKAEWKRFQTEDKAGFDRWMATTFGALLSRLRETESAIREKQALMQEVESTFFYGGFRSRRAAYAEVLRRRTEPPADDPRAGMPPPPSKEAEDDLRFDDLSDDDLEFLFEDLLHMAGMNPDRMSDKQYQKMFEDFKAGLNEGASEPPPAVVEKPKVAEDVRIKEIYRVLVRRLHPDTRADSDAEVSAIWHEVQEAYSHGNLERLEMLLAMTDMQSKATGEHTTLFQMRAVLTELRRAFNALQKNLREAKQDPAWGFSQLADRTVLEKGLRKKLETDLKWHEGDLRKMEAEIATWAAPEKPRGKNPFPPRATQTDFSF